MALPCRWLYWCPQPSRCVHTCHMYRHPRALCTTYTHNHCWTSQHRSTHINSSRDRSVCSMYTRMHNKRVTPPRPLQSTGSSHVRPFAALYSCTCTGPGPANPAGDPSMQLQPCPGPAPHIHLTEGSLHTHCTQVATVHAKQTPRRTTHTRRQCPEVATTRCTQVGFGRLKLASVNWSDQARCTHAGCRRQALQAKLHSGCVVHELKYHSTGFRPVPICRPVLHTCCCSKQQHALPGCNPLHPQACY
jgi:hypothetical protein